MENKNILASIALCTHNGEKYISQQLDSILSQDYKNFEIIIVDDCSTDDTISIIQEYTKREDCIKLFQNSTNLGFFKNFEKAISLCNGDYIFLCDQDDIWHEHKINTLINNIKKDSLLIYSDATLVDSNLKKIGDDTLLKKINILEGSNNLYFIFNNCMSGNTMMFKKELKKHILPFPENLTFHDVWIGFVASTISSVQYTNEPLVFYRQHDNNITNITRSKHREKQTLKEKIIKKSIAMKQKSNYLAAYYNFLQKNSQDNKNMNIIKNISKEYCQYENYYFNIKLFSLLLNHKNDIFISKKQKRLSFILKNCLGLKAYKLVHFL